jgi:hypothetical protein
MPNTIRTPNATIRDLIAAAFAWYKWDSPDAYRFDGRHEWVTPDDAPRTTEVLRVSTDDGVPGYMRKCELHVTQESNDTIKCGNSVCTRLRDDESRISFFKALQHDFLRLLDENV